MLTPARPPAHPPPLAAHPHTQFTGGKALLAQRLAASAPTTLDLPNFHAVMAEMREAINELESVVDDRPQDYYEHNSCVFAIIGGLSAALWAAQSEAWKTASKAEDFERCLELVKAVADGWADEAQRATYGSAYWTCRRAPSPSTARE